MIDLGGTERVFLGVMSNPKKYFVKQPIAIIF